MAKQSKIKYSEHAKVRLFERGLLINVDAILEEMFGEKVREAIDTIGDDFAILCDCPFTKRRVKLVVRNRTVVTIK